MVGYINLLLQAAKHIGEVKDLWMHTYENDDPDLIKITGVAEDGEKFSLTLSVGEYKYDS